MKFKEQDLYKNIKNLKAALIYGSDNGQVSEVCDKSLLKLGIEKSDIFKIDSSELTSKMDELYMVLHSYNMFGGKKAVVISNCSDSSFKTISEIVKDNSSNAFIIVNSDQLKLDSKLRVLFEDESDLGIVACYFDDAKTLIPVIENYLTSNGITEIEPQAMRYMLDNFGEDRRVTNSFLEKIVLYTLGKNIVSLNDVIDCLPDTSASSLDNWLFAITDGDINKEILELNRLFYKNYEPEMLVRMLTMHFKRLITSYMDGQLPKNLYKRSSIDSFRFALKVWTEEELNSVLLKLYDLERRMRYNSQITNILISDFAFKLSVKAFKFKKKYEKNIKG